MPPNQINTAKFQDPKGWKPIDSFWGNKSRKALIGLFAASILIGGLCLNIDKAQGQSGGMTLPPGFATQIAAEGFDLPVDIEFLPSGDFFVAEKGSGQFEDSWSAIKLVKNGVVQNVPVIKLGTNSYWDSGYLGMALDPDFSTNHHFYVWYATGIHSSGWAGGSKLRLSRFTFNPQTGTADPASELIMLEEEPWSEIHHGNALLFDDAGNLLLAMGNRANLQSSQDFSLLYGKIIRIRPTDQGYEVPVDNPFLNDPSVRPEIYAVGFRNPYRFAKRSADDLVVVGDVGAATWEEIDIVTAGANYGFPEREGPCPYGQPQPCQPAPPQYTDPAVAYAHDASLGIGTSGAVTGLAFYEGTEFPEAYWNKLFFADFNQSFLASADPLNGVFQLFAENSQSIVDVEYFNESLFLVELRTGRIIQVYYAGEENQVPVAVLTAEPQSGPAPLLVTFSAAQSSDPDDVILKFHWDFGDGTPPLITDEPVVKHTYTTDGTYQARLQVFDIRGGESNIVENEITVYSGEFPNISLENLTDPNRPQYHGGDEILYQARRSNLDGLDPDQPFSWQVDFHHNEHIHPFISNSPVISDVLKISTDNHGGDWNIWFQFNLTMLTAEGQEVTVSRELFPELVDLGIESRPRSAQITINQANHFSPYAYKAIVNTNQEITARPTTIFEQDIWAFSHWQSAGEFLSDERELTIMAPQKETAYTAAYVYDRPAYNMWLPLIAK